MVNKELIKNEIDKVKDEYLEALYTIVIALGTEPNRLEDASEQYQASRWRDFIRETYGCLADDPIERGDQGKYEIRETVK